MLYMVNKPQATFEVKKLAIEAIKRNERKTDIAEYNGVMPSTIHKWEAKYRKSDGDINSLKRQKGSGRNKKLTEKEIIWIVNLTKQKASDYGFETDLWISSRIHSLHKKEFKKQISIDTIQRTLTLAGLTYHKPEKRYYNKDGLIKKKEEWFNKTRLEIEKTAKENNAVVYYEDEASISLTPILGKTWAPKGKTPTIEVTGNRGSIAAISAISSGGNLLFRLYDGKITSIEIIEFLKQLLQHHKRRHVVVVMDNATSHTSKKTQKFIGSQKRLHVFNFSPYSPEFNPDEKVWNHIKNHELKAHQAKTKPELKKLVLKKFTKMASSKSLVRGIFRRCSVAVFLR